MWIISYLKNLRRYQIDIYVIGPQAHTPIYLEDKSGNTPFSALFRIPTPSGDTLGGFGTIFDSSPILRVPQGQGTKRSLRVLPKGPNMVPWEKICQK